MLHVKSLVFEFQLTTQQLERQQPLLLSTNSLKENYNFSTRPDSQSLRQHGCCNRVSARKGPIIRRQSVSYSSLSQMRLMSPRLASCLQLRHPSRQRHGQLRRPSAEELCAHRRRSVARRGSRTLALQDSWRANPGKIARTGEDKGEPRSSLSLRLIDVVHTGDLPFIISYNHQIICI